MSLVYEKCSHTYHVGEWGLQMWNDTMVATKTRSCTLCGLMEYQQIPITFNHG